MPGIAEVVRADKAQFYWHLNDYRANDDFDQDLLAAPEYRSKHLSIDDYQRIEWQDFISEQIDPFGDIPVHLGIGNHEPQSFVSTPRYCAPPVRRYAQARGPVAEAGSRILP